MKTMNFKKTSLLTLSMVFLLSSCMTDKFDDINKDINYSNFDFKTIKDVKLVITTLTNQNQPLNGVYAEVYSSNPLNVDGSMLETSRDFLVYKGITNASGKLDVSMSIPTTIDSLTVLINHVGLPSVQKIKVGQSMTVTFGGNSVQSIKSKVVAPPTGQYYKDVQYVNGFFTLGTWNNAGLPNYLWNPNDVISADFLADVNASLPERIKLTESHPEYLASNSQGSLVLIEDAEVWVTFVHEGAGYLNTLGYYSYPTGEAPDSKNDITDATIIFPNVSFNGSGGSLVSGNKVQLFYFDVVKEKFTNVFPAGTTVSWFLKANGFSNGNVNLNATTYYSDIRFNPETTADKRIHNVLLKDDNRKLLLLGFEDLNRNTNSDEDFNDAVFYATVSPYTAVKTDFYKPIDSPKDADNDGVGDSVDEYPTDKDRAFNNYYPAKNIKGTLAFEDLWPNKGDYDFNDLVMDYNYNQVTNAQNNIVEVNAALTVRAVGASMRNGFALQFNTNAENVKSVTGQQFTKDLFQVNANGAERNQSKAVVPVFDDAFKVLKYTGSIVNTVVGGAYVDPQTINLKVVFNTPISLSAFGTPPYNPFMVINGERTKEIHLPGGAPTDLVDESLFGTGDDNTDLATKKYYMSDKYLPWGINIPVQFSYPAEKQDITKTYLVFDDWAKSRGFNYMDWYQSKNGYRDVTKIYTKR